MEKYENKINWSYVSKYQELSVKFMKKYENNISKELLMENKKI
jgi:hypothetical protein